MSGELWPGYDPNRWDGPTEQYHQAAQPPEGHGEQLSLFTPEPSELDRGHDHRLLSGKYWTFQSTLYAHGTSAKAAAAILKEGLKHTEDDGLYARGAYGHGGYVTRHLDTSAMYENDRNPGLVLGRVNARNPIHVDDDQMYEDGLAQIKAGNTRFKDDPYSAANELYRSRGHDVIHVKTASTKDSPVYTIVLKPDVFEPVRALNPEATIRHFGPGHRRGIDRIEGLEPGRPAGRRDHFDAGHLDGHPLPGLEGHR